jgi:hypothetical protein
MLWWGRDRLKLNDLRNQLQAALMRLTEEARRNEVEDAAIAPESDKEVPRGYVAVWGTKVEKMSLKEFHAWRRDGLVNSMTAIVSFFNALDEGKRHFRSVMATLVGGGIIVLLLSLALAWLRNRP